ncbi:MAG: 6-bladed beta-propeller [Anaerolineales bacterium]|nr:6-bladed beta-propeller [Anaerolineales bacterium]
MLRRILLGLLTLTVLVMVGAFMKSSAAAQMNLPADVDPPVHNPGRAVPDSRESALTPANLLEGIDLPGLNPVGEGQEGGPYQDGDGVWNVALGSGRPEPDFAGIQTVSDPDDFGYAWDDGEAFSWVDATTTGIDAGLSGNSFSNYTGPVSLGFSFDFYENTYDSLYIAASGYISFVDSGSWPWQQRIPNPLLPNNIVAPYATPLELATVGPANRVYYLADGTAPNRFFVVEWYQVAWNDEVYNFELILHEDGDIVLQYGTMTYAGDSYSCASGGIEDSEGIDGLSYIDFCDQATSNTAVRFIPPALAARVSFSPFSGGTFTRAGDELAYEFSLRNTGTLGPDTYDLVLNSTWPADLYNEAGEAFTDTDDDGTIDTGSLAQGEKISLFVDVRAPTLTNIGDNNALTLAATSWLDPGVEKSAEMRAAIPAPFAQAYVDNLDQAMSLYLARPQSQAAKKATPDDHGGEEIAIAETPDFIYAWKMEEWLESFSIQEIEYVLLDETGNPKNGVVKLTDHSVATMTTYDDSPAVAVAPNGNIGIVWWRYLWDAALSQYNYNVWFAILDSAGSQVLAPTNVTNNLVWGGSSDYNIPGYSSTQIAAAGDNRFVLAWKHRHQEVEGSVEDIYYAIRESNGSVVVGPTAVTSDTAGGSFYFQPILASMSSEHAFLSMLRREDGNGDILYVVIGSDGSLVKALTDLSEDETVNDWENYDAVQLSDGKILAAWEAWGCFGDEWKPRIRYALIDTNYNRIGSPACLGRAEAAQTGDNGVSIAADNAGHAAITWMDDKDQRRNLYYALVDSSGTVVTPPLVFLSAGISNYGDQTIETSVLGQGNTTITTDPTSPGVDTYLESTDSAGALPGGTVSIPIQVGNMGTSTATSVEISAVLDAGLIYAGDTSGIVPVQNGNTYTWHFPTSLEFLGYGEFSLDLTVPYIPCNSSLTVSLAVSSAQVDANPGDNSTGVTIVNDSCFALGEPGLSFRYVETFGVDQEPYPQDTDHLNGPSGIYIDGSDSLYVTEWRGFRMLRYNSSGVNNLVVGHVGLPWHHDDYLSRPADVAVDPDGNSWVLIDPALKQFDPDGNLLQTFPEEEPWDRGDANDRFNDPLGIAFDSQGRLFVSDTWNHRIQVYTRTISGTLLYSTTIGITGVPLSTQGGFDQPGMIAFDQSDNLYVVDGNNFRVQRCSYAVGWTCSTFFGVTGEWGDDLTHLGRARSVTVDSSDQVYIADSGNYRVLKCNTSGVCTHFAGTTGERGSDNGRFGYINDVYTDSGNNVYVSDGENHRIQKFNTSGTYLDTIGVTLVPYLADSFRLNGPMGLALAPDGSMYVAENLGFRLVKLDAAGAQQWTVGQAGVYGDDNNQLGAWWAGPEGNLAVDADGRIYVPDTGNNRIQIFNPDGSYNTTVGEYGTGTHQFECPSGVAIHPTNGQIYVSDNCSNRVQVYDSAWSYITTIGVTLQSGSDDFHFDGAVGVAVDASGSIYVPDRNNNRVQKCSLSGVDYTCSTFVGETGEFSGSFKHLDPRAVALDLSGRVYVADGNNNRVMVFDTTGGFLTSIGGEWGDGVNQFFDINGIALDSAGNLYVSDIYNHRVQKFAPGLPGWEQANLNGFGDWENSLSTLDVFGDDLYASTWHGIGPAQVWRSNSDGEWQEVTPAWAVENWGTYDAQVFGSHFYVGSANENGAGIWRMDGISWEQVASGGFGDANNEGITAFAVFSDTLYAAASNPVSGTEIWRSSTGGSVSWTQVNSDGFGSPGTTGEITMDVFDGYLYAGLGRGDPLIAELWRTNNGTDWSPVFTDGLENGDNTWVSSMAVFDEDFYIGLRNVTTGGEVWRSSDGASWSPVFTGGLGNANNQRPYGLIVHDNSLFLVFVNTENGSEVWKSVDGSTWQPVMQDGWGHTNYNSVDYFDKGAAVFQDDLYIGTLQQGGRLWRFIADDQVILSPGSSGSLYYTDPGGAETTVVIPVGAVASTTWLQYTAVPTVTASTGFIFAGTAFNLDAYIDGYLQSGFTFETPITVTLGYTETQVADLDENTLVLQYWDGGSWQDAACGLYDRHPDENWLSVPICHLTEFGWFAEGGYRIFLPLVTR